MKGFLEKMTATDFRKPVKRLVIITLIVVLACGALSAYMFRTQISEMAALKGADSQNTQVTETQSGHDGDGEKHGRDREIGDLIDSGLVTRPSTAAEAVGITSIVLCGLCALAYWLMVAAWLYKASAKAKMNRALWTILGLLTNLIAVLAFLIVRGRMTRCPSCGTWQKAAPYCGECGARLQIVCPNCGKVSSVSSDFCPNCGTALKEKKAIEADNT
jgi:ribosomal protein L32